MLKRIEEKCREKIFNLCSEIPKKAFNRNQRKVVEETTKTKDFTKVVLKATMTFYEEAITRIKLDLVIQTSFT